jgi:hypothetical protein
MDSTPSQRLNQREVASDLKAAVGARRELDDDMEDHVLEAFLARVDQRIVERVDQQVARTSAAAGPSSREDKRHAARSDAWVIPASLGVCIPLVGAAGGLGGSIGVVAVMVAAVILVASYLGTRSGN